MRSRRWQTDRASSWRARLIPPSPSSAKAPGRRQAGAPSSSRSKRFTAPASLAPTSRRARPEDLTPTVTRRRDLATPMAIGNYCRDSVDALQRRRPATGQGHRHAGDSGIADKDVAVRQLSRHRVKQLGGNGAHAVLAAGEYHRPVPQVRGVTHAGIRDGQSNTVFFAESRKRPGRAGSAAMRRSWSPSIPQQANTGGKTIAKPPAVAPATGPAVSNGQPLTRRAARALNIGSDIKAQRRRHVSRQGGQRRQGALFYKKPSDHAAAEPAAGEPLVSARRAPTRAAWCCTATATATVRASLKTLTATPTSGCVLEPATKCSRKRTDEPCHWFMS